MTCLQKKILLRNAFKVKHQTQNNVYKANTVCTVQEVIQNVNYLMI